MLIHPQFDPVAVQLGPVAVHWYGIMYLVGFALFLILGRRRAEDAWRGMTKADLEDLLFYGVLGVVLGGRLGFCLFYQPAWFTSHPLDVFKVWQGGMSAHGGMIGCIIAMLVFARTRGKSFWTVSDFTAPLVPLGLFAGRIGNFINGELWGRAALPDLPWAMLFPQTGDNIPRHPSQLYEAGLEGLCLFALLWWASAKNRGRGFVSALFCIGYGVARFFVEYFREPDSYLGLGLLGLSRGQWLSLPLILTGIAVLIWVWRPSHRERAV
ncbi:MAG: prolipoprotein diacylglyceryl transferase [Sutterella sp.]|jgi:prolipoprotein diacylglyceryl transferase|uniref:prolipoprotein diacylglyceryl transferase n=1 Tax=Duodenibacillus massiliensis TaxID=1852381 RepID=UPI00033DD6C4|nr:prolipoprotein diacylglyceryl transferase [Duodenibacillus massiliensis]MBS1386955.1 prolipoprotein diacylglyceryl transferase [Duodenibacillus sp.]MBS5791865.1 prolipoprotein diacylglyceryl transferase [Sutterella sp.]CDD69805.1 prolipoprotein diacylglyceryl transferase [Sutterella sp. CAG:397]